MPGQTGSETRIKTVVRSTRWSEAQFAELVAIAAYSECSEAEVLRRLVERANRQIVVSRQLVIEIQRIGANINQIARRLNSGHGISAADLSHVYRDLLQAVRLSKS